MSNVGLDTKVAAALALPGIGEEASRLLELAVASPNASGLASALLSKSSTEATIADGLEAVRARLSRVIDDPAQAETVLTALILNATGNALRAAKASSVTTQIDLSVVKPPFIDLRNPPKRHINADSCPVNLTDRAMGEIRSFERGNGTIESPFEFRYNLPINDFVRRLRILAVETRQPFLYGKTSLGTIEVAALIPLNEKLAYPGTENNPLTLDPRIYNRPYPKAQVMELARRYAITTDASIVYFQHGDKVSYTSRTSRYVGEGRKELPYLANVGESEADFIRHIREFARRTFSLADWVVCNDQPQLISRFSGGGKDPGDPLKPPTDLSYQQSDVFGHAEQVADFRKEVVYLDYDRRIHAVLPYGDGGSYYFPLELPTGGKLDLLCQAARYNDKPIHFYQRIDDPYLLVTRSVCLPGNEISSALREEIRENLINSRQSVLPFVSVIGNDGIEKEKIYPFLGNGSEQNCFRPSDPNEDRAQFLARVRDYDLRFKNQGLFAEIEGQPTAFTLCDGAGTLLDPFRNDLRDKDWLEAALKRISMQSEQLPIGKSKDGEYFIIPFARLEGAGAEGMPFENGKVPLNDPREAMRLIGIVKCTTGYYFKQRDKTEFIQTFEGKGTETSPIVIPAEAPAELITDQYLQNLRTQLQLKRLFVKMHDGKNRSVAE